MTFHETVLLAAKEFRDIGSFLPVADNDEMIAEAIERGEAAVASLRALSPSVLHLIS